MRGLSFFLITLFKLASKFFLYLCTFYILGFLFFVFLYFCMFVLRYFCTFVINVLLYFFIWSDSPYELPCKICSSKNGCVLRTLYFLCVFFVWTVHTNIYSKSGLSISKNERVMLNLVFSEIPLLLGSWLCLKGSR